MSTLEDWITAVREELHRADVRKAFAAGGVADELAVKVEMEAG